MPVKPSHLNTVGQSYLDFVITKAIEIPEMQCFLRELTHQPTGAQIIHIANEDPENLFCLSFRTLPYNSNGVAHILEHTVLCGSEKFPVKDPFFAMNRRSLNTFMNALTGEDFTCYPAASQVHQDFYNLLDVYLDAVFHPILNKLSFLQEGHRIEFANHQDPESPLEYKGIVYNEMKGALSSPSARLSEALHTALFPNTNYGFNSGGDPKEIPTLTYDNLRNFHHDYYQPSRCLFYFYGNIPLEQHLDFIAKHTLDKAKRADPLPPIPLQPRFLQPRSIELSYPISLEESSIDKTFITFGWLTCQILEQEEVLALNILEIILLGNDASPLKMAFLKSGLCTQVSSFVDDELNEIPFGITLKGCNPENANALESVLKETLNTIVKQGIPIQMIENAMHQLEFYRSEITGNHTPFGLSLFMRSALLKHHGAETEQGLVIHSLFDHIRKYTLKDSHYLTDLIQKYFIDNPHYVRIVMKPDSNLGSKEVEEEKRRLESIKKHLTPKQVESLVSQAAELSEFQKQQEDVDEDVLPKISLKDVPPSAREYPLSQEKIGSLEVFHHAVFTNDVIYADLVLDLPELPEEELFYLRILAVVLSQVGCNGRNYKENLDYIQGNTGGIGAHVSLNIQAQDHNTFKPTIHLKGKALHRKAPKLFPLMHDILMEPDLQDLPRLKEIILKHFTAIDSHISQGALSYAINLSASSLNVASKVANDLYGLNYYWKIKKIVNEFDNQAPYLMAKLQDLHGRITGLENPHLVISCDHAAYNQFKDHGFYGLKDIETRPFTPWKGDFPLDKVPSQGRIIASSVAFIGQVFSTISYIHPDAAALNIAAYLFDNLTLHSRIREQGGAYGGGAVSNPTSGNFYFYSYRDPQVVNTIQAFKDAVKAVENGEFDETDLEEAKLEMIQALDSPVAPGSRGDLTYGRMKEGKTFAIRQTFRKQLLQLTPADIIKAVQKHIIPQVNKASTVVFAGKDLLEKENEKMELLGKTLLPIESI